MKKKSFIMMLLVLVSMVLMQLSVFAMESVTTEVGFKVKEGAGTILIESVSEEAPMPEITEYKDVTEGVFKFEFSEPDTYYYKIYQKAGDEEDVTYDETVYNVIVFITAEEDGSLTPIVTIGVDGDGHKPEEIEFTNVRDEVPPEEGTPGSPGQKPGDVQTGDNSRIDLWVMIAIISFALLVIICVITFFEYEKKKRTGNSQK